MDYYELLGLPADASREQIRATYRLRVARAHPDVNGAVDAEQETALLNEAWSVLRDPATRAAYDAAGLATSAALRCQSCAATTPELRFVVFSRARGRDVPRNEGSLVCPACRKREARSAAFASLARGGYADRRSRRVTLSAIVRDLRGGKVDRQTSAALLRQIGFAYARENRSVEALGVLQAVLGFGEDAAVARIVARLREAEGGRVTVAPSAKPARPPTVQRRSAWAPRAVWASCAVLLFAAIAFRFTSHRSAAPVLAGPASVELARNVDPALRDDVVRLSGAVRPRDLRARTYLFELPNDKAFAAAYDAAVATLPLADRASNPWLVTLETTSLPSDTVAMPRSDDYVLAQGCAPQTCDDGFVSIAYDAAKGAVAGAAYFGDRWHAFGSDAPADRAMVVLAVARNRLPLERRFALPPAREAELRHFIDNI